MSDGTVEWDIRRFVDIEYSLHMWKRCGVREQISIDCYMVSCSNMPPIVNLLIMSFHIHLYGLLSTTELQDPVGTHWNRDCFSHPMKFGLENGQNFITPSGGELRPGWEISGDSLHSLLAWRGSGLYLGYGKYSWSRHDSSLLASTLDSRPWHSLAAVGWGEEKAAAGNCYEEGGRRTEIKGCQGATDAGA